MNTVLSQLNVLEIASVLAGPAVGMYFAERGATVTKIENANTNGDVTRGWKLPSESKENPISAYYSAVNWGKETLFMDLSDSEEREALEKMIKEADILITNFKYGDAKKLRLDFETVASINPQIIHGEISGFGLDNPRVAYDLVLQAETGFISMNGEVERRGVKMPIALIDVLAAHQLKEGILEALLLQARNKKAIHVAVSLYDAAIASLANQASNYLMTGHIPQPMGSKHPNIAPYGETFTSKDGQLVTFAIGGDHQFKKLCELLEIPIHEKFETNKSRVENRQEIAGLLESVIKKWDAEDLIEKMIEHNIPAARIKDLAAVFNEKSAQELVLTSEMEGVETKRVKTAVYKLSSI